MNDLISRQAAIEAVEESRRLNHHQDGKAACAHEYEHRHFLKILRDLPSAQPEIIYCKDCKWKSRHNCTRAVEVPIDDDKYCAWAERRTDETD